MDILLKNAQIVTLNDNDDIIGEGSIGIRDNRIDFIGEGNYPPFGVNCLCFVL